MKQYVLIKDTLKGLWKENPVFRQLLGMCPTLAVTNAAVYGLSMGLATAFVLLCTSIIISIFRKVFPYEVRTASFVVIIATFVTIVDLFLKGNYPSISKALGPYIPLIVVNCLILARQEAFASRQPVHSRCPGNGNWFYISLNCSWQHQGTFRFRDYIRVENFKPFGKRRLVPSVVYNAAPCRSVSYTRNNDRCYQYVHG